MKESNLMSIVGLFFGTCSIVSAADILHVGNPGGGPTDSFVEFLTNEGHTVTLESRRDGPEDANDFDLVIISQDTNTSGYNQPGQDSAWNAVTAPIISFSVFFYKQSVWGWDSDPGDGIGGNVEVLDTPYPDPAHPFLSGLEAPTGTIMADTGGIGSRRPKVEFLLPTGSTIVATGEGTTTLGIFTIDAGTPLTSLDGETAAGNIRIAWPIGSLYGWDYINSNGEQILRNMIATVAPEPPRITSTSIGSESGDFLVNFSPAGTNNVLKSSNDLISPFEEETSAILENDNTTFRVPAANLNPIRDFFLIEEAP